MLSLKKLITILLIVSFFVQSTSYQFILLFFKLNRDYIAANLCINRFDSIPLCKGSCYLEEQLRKNKQHEDKLPDLKTKEITLYYNTSHNELRAPVSDSFVKKYFFYNCPFISAEYCYSVFRPPCFMV